MKNLFYLSQIILVLVPFISFANGVKLQTIKFADLKPRIGAKSVLVIDPRLTVFFESEHIPNAISLPLIGFNASYNKTDKKYNLKNFGLIIVYCADNDCDDSEKLGCKLSEEGSGNIAIYKGWWQEWKERKK